MNEEPRNGVGTARRQLRASPGSAGAQPEARTAVTAHFLVSPFGTGSNYQDAGTAADPVVNFAAVDGVITMAAAAIRGISRRRPRRTSASRSRSRRREIRSCSPSLLGRAPGWPTTDLLVINDNNKAQRNMGVGPDRDRRLAHLVRAHPQCGDVPA